MSIPRRSERKTKGIPPERYEDAPDNLKQATESRKSTHPSCTHDKSISRVESKITKSSNSRRKLLEIEIEEARKLAEIERRKAEIDAEMIIKEAQLRREIIQEGSSEKSTISGAESIFDLREITFQEKVDNWKTEETDNYVPPTTNNFITMTSDNFNQICETFKINADEVNYNERTRSVKSKLPFFDGNPEDWPIFHSQFEHSTKISNICEEENIIRLQRCLEGLKQRCGIDGCQKFHNNILHNLDYKKRDEPQVENTPDIVLDQDDHIERINFFQEESPTILLRIIPVKLRGRKKEISTFALLDEAATTTMIDSRIVQEIGLDGPLERLCYQWLNNVTKSEENSRKVSLEISGIEENSKKYRIKDVRTVNGLSLPKQTLDVKKMSESYPYIKETPVCSFFDAQPTILIGQDQCALTIARQIFQSFWNAPFVSKTLLGWVVHDNGPLVYLFGMTNPSSLLTKFRLIVEEYDFSVTNSKGSQNVVADAVSRVLIEADELKIMNEKVSDNIYVMIRAETKKRNNNGDGNISANTTGLITQE
ncbi:hypothetical protein JTB14_007920 [Gonioctena quinquepunctata]|nr:hypothetical protein JTB14_007920 [Gonioctena quinquepunctata]